MDSGLRASPGLPGILGGHEKNRAKAEAFKRIACKIDISGPYGCWEWIGASQSNNYGRVWDGSKTVYAHRFVWTVFYGLIDEDLDIDHLCRNRRCVNPLHLEPVTRSENLKRGLVGENIAALQREKTHCPAGHAYAGENLSRRNGRRYCKACKRMSYHRNKLKRITCE